MHGLGPSIWLDALDGYACRRNNQYIAETVQASAEHPPRIPDHMAPSGTAEQAHIEQRLIDPRLWCTNKPARIVMFSNCGLSHKGIFCMSHWARGSLRGRELFAARPMMASGTGCLQRSVARSMAGKALPRHSTRDHPASVPVGQRSVLVERIGCFYALMPASPPWSRRRWFRRATGAASPRRSCAPRQRRPF